MNIDLFPTIIYSCMLGVTLFALLEVWNEPKQRQNLYLGGLFALLLIHILGELFIYSGAYQYAPGLAGLNFPLRVLMGPALYFYACAAMSSDQQLSKSAVWIALSGPVVVVAVMLPFLFGLSSEQKLALADPATRNPDHWQLAIFICSVAETEATTQTPRVPALKPQQMQQVADKLEKVMKDEQLFLEEDLSLNRLSGSISVNENHISETLSQHLKTNFSQFANGHRIDAAKDLLLSSDKLVSTIGYEVGFNTKSTFKSAFKKSTGVTPAAFRKQANAA